MDLSRYVEELRHELMVAAEAGGDDARLLAERLVGPLQSAVRLVLLDALTAAAGDITTDLAPGSVEVRMRGRDPEFVVTAPASDAPAELAATPVEQEPAQPRSAGGDADDSGTARITLRLPEPLKVRIEDAAARDGVSVNAWLVRSLASVVEPTDHAAAATRRSASGGQRFTGWAR